MVVAVMVVVVMGGGGGGGSDGGGISFLEAAQTHTNFPHHGFHSDMTWLQQGDGHSRCRSRWNVG